MIELPIYSPVTKIPSFNWPTDTRLFEEGIQVLLKRDDQIHPYISGNKWRKLKYLLQRAQTQGKNHLVTFGGAWSNHLLATACAGAMFGFKTTGFIRGEEQVSNPVLSLCSLFGMRLIFTSRDAYRDRRTLFDAFAQESNDDLFMIDEGGRSEDALLGCSEIIDELVQQRIDFDHLFCACGTGTTLAGLSLGLTRHHHRARLHGVPVLKDHIHVRENIQTLQPQAMFDWHTDYHFGGYARHRPELIQFVQDFCRRTGVMIEPIYTGKLCYTVYDLYRKNYFKPQERILILHSGGLTGFLGKHELFSK